jgi:hypothetical protein
VHEVAIEGYLKNLEAADTLVDSAEREWIEKALAELEREPETKREPLAATAAKKLVVAEPESVIFGESDDSIALRLKAAPDLLAKRTRSVEPAFGTLERWLPILPFETRGGRFLLSGRGKARTELGLLTLAFNLDCLTNLHGAAKLQAALA